MSIRLFAHLLHLIEACFLFCYIFATVEGRNHEKHTEKTPGQIFPGHLFPV